MKNIKLYIKINILIHNLTKMTFTSNNSLSELLQDNLHLPTYFNSVLEDVRIRFWEDSGDLPQYIKEKILFLKNFSSSILYDKILKIEDLSVSEEIKKIKKFLSEISIFMQEYFILENSNIFRKKVIAIIDNWVEKS